MKRKEVRASLKVLPKENGMSTLIREVSKTVKGSDGKDFKRTATINIEVAPDFSDLAGLIASFGNVEKLANAAYYGVIAKAKQDANNELMKGDKASKALKKMIASLKAVMPTLSDDQASAMVLSNPAMAEAFKSEPVTAEVTISVNPANQVIPSVNDAEVEAEEAEEDKAA